MDVDEAGQLARRLLDQHGLVGWHFSWDRARRRFGCCWTKRKLITLSRPLTELNERAEVLDTLLHEIAHALAPGGHTAAWRRKCVEIGARPQRCYSGQRVKLPEISRRHRYVAVCRCPLEHVRRRKPTRSYLCRTCRAPLAWERQMMQPAENSFADPVTD